MFITMLIAAHQFIGCTCEGKDKYASLDDVLIRISMNVQPDTGQFSSSSMAQGNNFYDLPSYCH